MSQLANLGAKLTILVNALQNERDATLLVLSGIPAAATPNRWRRSTRTTGTAVTAVQRQWPASAALPSNIQTDVTSVLADISPLRLACLPTHAVPDRPPAGQLAVIANYGADINDMITLADQVGQGVSDASLASDVRALNALALAKDQASQQRALLNFAFADPAVVGPFSYPKKPGVTNSPVGTVSVKTASPDTVQALIVADHRSSSMSRPSSRRRPRPRPASFANQRLSGRRLGHGHRAGHRAERHRQCQLDLPHRRRCDRHRGAEPVPSCSGSVGRWRAAPASYPENRGTTTSVSTPGGLEVQHATAHRRS